MSEKRDLETDDADLGSANVATPRLDEPSMYA
jgi:hypothetical protein